MTTPSKQHVLALVLYYNDLTQQEFLDLSEKEKNSYYENAGQLINCQDYFVGTYEESYQKMEECIDNFYQELILPELEKITNNKDSSFQPFNSYIKFDYKTRFRDMKMGGMGERIASYDGQEHIIEVDGTIFYIFRLN